ncbi:hypothetical protein GYH30_006907 [Glycine max]|uniref:Uncharacterized protein n=1 Tax=Glycine max TaxID=3847 RepID=K7KEE1_SOYBN|nr:hypothetical protein GYH30_006907 [Glycine max]
MGEKQDEPTKINCDNKSAITMEHASDRIVRDMDLQLLQAHVSVQLYSPFRPAVDIAEVFLWMMAVLTILCASYWSARTTREAVIEQDKLLKDALDEIPNTKYASVSGVVNMNVKAAVLFVVFALCFLFMLYKLMSSWFIDVLVVLFCIGGIEGLQTCLVALLSRWFKHAEKSYIKDSHCPFNHNFFFIGCSNRELH